MEDRKTNGRPLLTYLLLVANAIIQTYISALPVHEALRFYDEYALIPVRFFNGTGFETLVTYMFLHGNWMHFLVNAIAIWGSGGIVEKDIGSSRFALTYLVSGVMAGLVHSFLNTSSEIHLVGSSGAIFGIIAVLFLLMPFKITFTLIIPLPSVLVGIMLSAAEFSAVWLATDAAVAHDAHLGGFIIGCLCAFAIDRRRALRGLIVAAVVFVVLYYLGIYFRLT